MYVGDILIYSATYNGQVYHARTMLTRLLHHQLYVKLYMDISRFIQDI